MRRSAFARSHRASSGESSIPMKRRCGVSTTKSPERPPPEPTKPIVDVAVQNQHVPLAPQQFEGRGNASDAPTDDCHIGPMYSVGHRKKESGVRASVFPTNDPPGRCASRPPLTSVSRVMGPTDQTDDLRSRTTCRQPDVQLEITRGTSTDADGPWVRTRRVSALVLPSRRGTRVGAQPIGEALSR